MTDSKNLSAKPAEWIRTMAGKATPADALNALNALNQIVAAARESIAIHETESTKREQAQAHRDIEVERIRASERTLRDYFDRIFAERRDIHKRLFDSLDTALASGDVAAMQTVVGGIVEVARTSPLADLGNLSELRRAMDDPDAVFEL